MYKKGKIKPGLQSTPAKPTLNGSTIKYGKNLFQICKTLLVALIGSKWRPVQEYGEAPLDRGPTDPRGLQLPHTTRQVANHPTQLEDLTGETV